jgi:hypothetical protein
MRIQSQRESATTLETSAGPTPGFVLQSAALSPLPKIPQLRSRDHEANLAVVRHDDQMSDACRSKKIDPEEAETKEDEDVIPRGLGYYRATSGPEYEEDHLRDPSYYYQAHRLAYPNLPDAGNKSPPPPLRLTPARPLFV